MIAFYENNSICLKQMLSKECTTLYSKRTGDNRANEINSRAQLTDIKTIYSTHTADFWLILDHSESKNI